MIKASEFELLGEKIKVERAKEPSDIVWENIGYKNQNCLLIVVYLTIIILCLTLLCFYLRYRATDFLLKYSNPDCRTYDSLYDSEELYL